MGRISQIVLSFAALALVAAAPGKWHPFVWGMSKADLRAKVGGLRQGDPDTLTGLGDAQRMLKTRDTMEGDVTIDGQKFYGHFGFDKGGLGAVMLSAEGYTACALVLAALHDRYGDPDTTRKIVDMTAFQWNAAAQGDYVSYWSVPGRPGCSINLLPLKAN